MTISQLTVAPRIWQDTRAPRSGQYTAQTPRNHTGVLPSIRERPLLCVRGSVPSSDTSPAAA